MGFRCPNCRQDFGNKKEDLDAHLSDSKDCSSDANFILMKKEFVANINVTKKKRVLKYTDAGLYKEMDVRNNNVKRQHTFIGDHDWVKLNAVSNEDGSDNMKCRRCGLKAMRYMSGFQFDKRASANKIENCKNNKQV
jgi:uncharacterized C2H2 Zn-finger protein